MEKEPIDPEPLSRRGTIALSRELVERLGLLARKELELAEVEGRVDARHGLAAGLEGSFALVMLAGALSCVAMAIVDGLAQLMTIRRAAILLGAILAGLGGLFLRLAARQAHQARPRRSIREARATLRMLIHREERAPHE